MSTSVNLGPCNCCSTCCPADSVWTVHMNGSVGPPNTGEINGCTDLSNYTWTLPVSIPPDILGNPQIWRTTPDDFSSPYVDCVAQGQGGYVEVFLICPFTPGGPFQVEFRTSDTIGLANYIQAAPFNCNGCTVFNLADTEPNCCVFPSTITVCKVTPFMMLDPELMWLPTN